MCTGRFDSLFVLKAFADGADGVLISGCHFGDCHYLEGNYKSAKRMFMVKRLMKSIGLDDRRFRMTFVSASEGAKWAKVVTDVVNTVKELGPSPLKENKESLCPGDPHKDPVTTQYFYKRAHRKVSNFLNIVCAIVTLF